MRVLFASAMGAALATMAAAQQRNPPPITTAPPPAVPNVTPARPQPGVAIGASGSRAAQGRVGGVTRPPLPTNEIPAPFPVVVPPGTHPLYPEVFDPLAVIELLDAATAPQPPDYGRTARGRPDGLGVTITGGDASPGGRGVTITGGNASPPPIVQTQTVIVVTNTIPTNSSGTVTNVPRGPNPNAPGSPVPY